MRLGIVQEVTGQRLQRVIKQLELALEELEAEEAGADPGAADDDSGADAASRPASARAKPARRPLPEHLPREIVEHPAPGPCLAQIALRFRCACGGSLRPLGEDVTEVLDWMPGRFRVVRHVRPKCSCRLCEAICQAPSLPIRRGRAGPGLLAHVVVGKYADHLPLCRQAEISAASALRFGGPGTAWS